ncbi:MAG TPA: LUD domain-containing protein [Candidatus Acidoferrales bacterium]|nr:LUD domain-containing protein [Candidatus Acidoferrales bacterium]
MGTVKTVASPAVNAARENILTRIAKANPDSRTRPVSAGSDALDAIFPAIPNQRQRFLDECAGNLTEVFVTTDAAHSADALALILSTVPAGEVYVQHDPALQPLISVLKEWRTVKLSSEGAPAESIQATVTLAHGFVAQTGSILMSSACGGRGASIVPPCHIVYGRGEQIVADIAAALARVADAIPDASYVGLITGSSRTADIEKILVQGAHGPRRLVVILEG